MRGYSKRSLENLKGVNPKLVIILAVAIERGNVDFTIIDGFRTATRQAQLYKQGASKCDGYHKKSYHQSGNAIDFIPYPFDNNWNNVDQFKKVGEELKRIAEEFGINCKYGGDWTKFRDYPHFEIRN